MATGRDLLKLAESRIGEKYVNVLVPKDNSNWHGAWDCAEFVSWIVFQKVGKLFGCTDNNGNPATTEAYSGAWARDASDGTLLVTDKETAINSAGVILIRRPPMPGNMGHVAISDGKGRTVEAAGTGLGVTRDNIEGRLWHFYTKVPEVTYQSTGVTVVEKPLPYLLTLEELNMSGALVKRVQRALKDAGINPGKIDGLYGPHTVAAVFAFQKINRLVADGIVGPKTAKKLGVEWPV